MLLARHTLFSVVTPKPSLAEATCRTSNACHYQHISSKTNLCSQADGLLMRHKQRHDVAESDSTKHVAHKVVNSLPGLAHQSSLLLPKMP